ncbi:MAG: hypothetical protein ACREHF_02155 [Rhizomicrobium sp.]
MTGSVLPAWPVSVLPAPSLSDNLSQEYPDLVTRTDFSQGLSRQRSNWSQGATTQWITWPMNAAQMRVFHGFWRNEISNGADWFTMPIFNDDCYRTFKVRFVDVAQPVGPSSGAQITRNAGEWMYAAVIETADETAPDEIETATLILTYQQTLSLSDIVGALDDAIATLGGALA